MKYLHSDNDRVYSPIWDFSCSTQIHQQTWQLRSLHKLLRYLHHYAHTRRFLLWFFYRYFLRCRQIFLRVSTDDSPCGLVVSSAKLQSTNEPIFIIQYPDQSVLPLSLYLNAPYLCIKQDLRFVLVFPTEKIGKRKMDVRRMKWTQWTPDASKQLGCCSPCRKWAKRCTGEGYFFFYSA